MACVLKFDGVNDYAVMDSEMVLAIGDTLEIKATASSGNDGGAYRILGRNDGFENLIELADADINVRIGNSANNKVSTNYTKPAVGVSFSFFLERLSSSLYEVRLDATTIGQISSSLDFKPNSVAGFNTSALFVGTIEYIKNGTVNNWDATSSDTSNTGLQPILVDTIAGNNATGVNMPTDGSAWEGCDSGLSITPTGIASAESFGTGVITTGSVDLAPTGIVSSEAFGSHTVTQGAFLTPSGIASEESFGTAVLSTGAVTVSPSGIASAEAFGTAVISQGFVLSPTGIASAESFGTAAITTGAVVLTPAGISSEEAFGSHSIGVAGDKVIKIDFANEKILSSNLQSTTLYYNGTGYFTAS